MAIQYNYPLEELDRLVTMIYDEGITPMMTPDLQTEVELRYQELQHGEYYDDEDDDEEYRSAKEKHDEAMKRMEANKRKSHSRNIIILDLTEEELSEIHEGCATSYIRNDPNSIYNMSDEDLSSDAEKRQIMKELQSLGKIYYHQADFRNAMNIIMKAIDYSLKNDYPWMSYEEACQQFREGKIKYTYAQIPLLYIDYNTQITDPKLLAGICDGSINLIDKDAQKPIRKKKHKSNPVSFPCSIIGPTEHMEMVKIHQAGYDTEISPILKSCSTIYNRYVIPASFTWANPNKDKPMPEIDWTQPGAGQMYFNAKYGKTTNNISEVIALLNAENERKLNHVIGSGLRDFIANWNKKDELMSFKSISTSLQQNDQAVEIENRLLNLMRESNPNI